MSPESANHHTVSSSLTGRVTVVTGAASGIGEAVARHLPSVGSQVALLDLHSARLDAPANSLAEHGCVYPIDGGLTA